MARQLVTLGQASETTKSSAPSEEVVHVWPPSVVRTKVSSAFVSWGVGSPSATMEVATDVGAATPLQVDAEAHTSFTSSPEIERGETVHWCPPSTVVMKTG